MTSINGGGAGDWAGVLAAVTRSTEVDDQTDDSVLFRLPFDGDDYFVSLTNFSGDFRWPGGSADDGEIPSGPVDNIRVYNASTDQQSDIFALPSGATVDSLLDFSRAGDVEAFLLSGDDRFSGSPGANLFNGRAGDDQLLGGGRQDTLSGGLDDDSLEGFAGLDRLDGGKGADLLAGGLGRDLLTGGNGRDVFAFKSAAESSFKRTERDVVTDFDRGSDRLDLAPGLSDGEELDFIGDKAFDGAYQLRYEADDKGVTVFANLDDDTKAEFSVRLEGLGRLAADDFII